MEDYNDKNLQLFLQNSSFKFKMSISCYKNGDYEMQCEEMISRKRFNFIINVETIRSFTKNYFVKVNRSTFYQFIVDCLCKNKYDISYDEEFKIILKFMNEDIILTFKNLI